MLQAFNPNKQARNKGYAVGVGTFPLKESKAQHKLDVGRQDSLTLSNGVHLESCNTCVGELCLNSFLNISALSFHLSSEYRVVVFFTCFLLPCVPPLRHQPGDGHACRRAFALAERCAAGPAAGTVVFVLGNLGGRVGS